MTIVERMPLVVGYLPENQRYLATKALRMGHWLEPGEGCSLLSGIVSTAPVTVCNIE